MKTALFVFSMIVFISSCMSRCPLGRKAIVVHECVRQLQANFGDAADISKLDKTDILQRRLGCCIIESLEKCYREKLTGACSATADSMASNTKKVMVEKFAPCNFNCHAVGRGRGDTPIVSVHHK
ncbi:uncharacterized protein LOC135400361 [Ornithodoros turicata]|uniref:uncharacterized protein LOC135400361 n=1 Tax=Ornithodoros turicata TaxID=34597 RepID=UPI0031395B66